MAEGIGLFAGVIFLLTGHMLALAAVAVAVAALVSLLPTRDRVAGFLASVTGQA
jgi:hypothetical protein